MRWQFSLILLFALALAGCTTTRKATREQTQAKPPSSHEEENSTEASDRRTEAHARYANGVLFDINEEPEKAAEEFYKAALTDPADEELVLEASQHML